MAANIPQDFRAPFFHKNWVRFLNASGEAIPPFAVMQIASTTISNGEIIYGVVKPTTTFSRRYLVNGPTTCGSASTHEGWGTFLSEGGPVLFGSGSPADSDEWGATASQWYLTQHRPGFIVSGSATTTAAGNNVLIAKQFVVQVVYGKADTAIAKNASGTVRIYGGAFGSESDTSLTIASCYNKTSAILDEATVTVSWPHGRPLVANLVCT